MKLLIFEGGVWSIYERFGEGSKKLRKALLLKEGRYGGISFR